MIRAGKIFATLTALPATLYALPLAAAEEKSGGLPQLNASYYPGQMFWLAICFGILYLLMAFVALPGVRRTQDKRQEVIETELAAATVANDTAKAMATQYEKALADARANAQTTVNDIKTAAAKESSERQAAQEKELTARLHEAEKNIGAARDAAIADIRQSANDLAAQIIERVAGVKLPVQEAR